MSTSSRHNWGGVLNAIDTLHSYLSDPGSGTNKHANHRTLTQSIYEFKQLQSMDHHGHSESTHMMNNNDGDSSLTTNKIREMMNKAFDSISLSNPEEMDTMQPRCNLVDDDQLMQAYSYFFIMEDGAVIKKKDLIYWWVAQGVIKDNDGDAEAAASVLLQKLVHLKVVERITCTERRKELCKYRAVKGMMINQEHQIRDGLQNVGMLESQRKRSENSIELINPNGKTIDNEKSIIEMLYNRDVSFIDIPREWLSNAKRKSNLTVLQLGRWSGDNNNNPEKNHMEVVNMEILLKELKQLKKVRLISFRGVSGIMELGDEICSLGDNLRVLDLQACHNLEVLPKGIGNLMNLTHLDLSECYLLDRIPKGITSLTKLQVLEGFVVSDVVTSSSCKFKDLATHLGTTLKKLSIRTRNVSFPAEEEDLEAFAKFEKLLRLKVVWVQVSRIIDDDVKKEKQDGGEQKPSLMRKATKQFRREANAVGLPKQLQKLEVQAIPQDVVKSLIWSSLDRLTQLKKLTIIGGHVFDLTNQGDIKWEMVKTLQLKHLNNLCMNWREFKESFPQLIYLQKIGCPNLHFFPCDIAGIWRQS